MKDLLFSIDGVSAFDPDDVACDFPAVDQFFDHSFHLHRGVPGWLDKSDFFRPDGQLNLFLFCDSGHLRALDFDAAVTDGYQDVVVPNAGGTALQKIGFPDKVGDKTVFRFFVQLVRWADLLDSPVHHGHAVRQGEGLFLVVGDRETVMPSSCCRF